jgi:hypothetical protein
MVFGAETNVERGEQPLMNNPKPTPDIFIYKLVADNGGAPCVSGNALSLAICKPKIRKVADKGSIIFGFGGKRYGEKLIYIAVVTDKRGVDYYKETRFAERPDCIYEISSGAAHRKKSAKFHKDTDERPKDIGAQFKNAHVLLSDDFRYFGKNGTADYKKRFERVKTLIEGLKQGHRRHLDDDLRRELMSLKNQIWRSFARKKLGPPSDGDQTRRCNTDSPSAVC